VALGLGPNGTPTLPPPFPPRFDSGGKRLKNLEALGLRVGCYPPPPGPVGLLGYTPEIGGPVDGPTYQKKKNITRWPLEKEIKKS